MTYQLAKVLFHGQSLVTIKKDEVEFVAMKPIVEGIGLAWGAQSIKLKQLKDKFSCFDIETTGKDGKTYAMLCIPLRKLNGWLFTINPSKVRPEIREKVVQYQEECFEALHDYWHTGRALSPRQQPQLPPSSRSRSILPIRIESSRPVFDYPTSSWFSPREKEAYMRTGAPNLVNMTYLHLLEHEEYSPLRRMLTQVTQEGMGDVSGCVDELDSLYEQLRIQNRNITMMVCLLTELDGLTRTTERLHDLVSRIQGQGRMILIQPKG